MRPFVRAGMLLLAAACLPALAAAAPPRVVEASGDKSGISIQFDQPMLTWGGETTGALVGITPDAPCRWYWEDDTVLRCSVGAGAFPVELATAAVYRLQLDGLWAQSGEALAATSVEVPIDPPRVYARLREWANGWPLIVLEGGHRLPADAVRDVLDLRFDGEPIGYRLEPAERTPWERVHEPDGVAWRLLPEPRAGAGRLTASLRAGLVSPLGPARGVAVENLFDYAVGEAFGFAGWRCWQPDAAGRPADDPAPCAPEQGIQLRFTRPLSAAAVETIRTRLPAGAALADNPTDCGYECNRRQAAPLSGIAIATMAPGRGFVIDLPADLAAADGTRLGEAVRVAIPVDSFGPSYHVQSPVRVGLPAATTPAPVDARNIAGGDRWTTLAIGERIRRTTARVGLPDQRDVFSPVRMPRPDRRVTRDGGLLLQGSQGQRQGARATAVAPFQLLVGAGPSSLTAWASEWADGRGVADATLDLLDIDWDGSGKVVGSARTGADGLARLPQPAAAPPRKGLRVLRAVAGGRVTVVPLGGLTSLSLAEETGGDASRWWGGRPDADGLAFGATARLLYRPGERVDYRIWHRRRDGNRLLQADEVDEVALRLRAQWPEADYATWTVPLDRWGSAAGRLTLPALLPDGTYCIERAARTGWGTEAPCFTVARFSDQAMWAELAADPTVLRPGATLALAVAGGFYSGGPAAAARLRIDGLVVPADFAAVYPAFARYDFLDPQRHAGGESENDPLSGVVLPERLGADGRLRVSTVLPARFVDTDSEMDVDDGLAADTASAPSIAFARLQFNASLRMDGGAEAASPTATVHFAEFPRYVGLATRQWSLPVDADPVLDAVVVDAHGDAVAGLPVDVRIESTGGDGPGTVLARCALVAGTPAACAFRAPAAGAYAIVAEAADAAPVRIVRWFGGADTATTAADKATIA